MTKKVADKALPNMFGSHMCEGCQECIATRYLVPMVQDKQAEEVQQARAKEAGKGASKRVRGRRDARRVALAVAALPQALPEASSGRQPVTRPAF
jgi:hypothetical protein